MVNRHRGGRLRFHREEEVLTPDRRAIPAIHARQTAGKGCPQRGGIAYARRVNQLL